jgi:hypothetical protein
MAVSFPVPSLLIDLPLNNVEIIVPQEIIIDIIPAYDTGTFNVSYMLGHAEPKRVSGNPRLMNEI